MSLLPLYTLKIVDVKLWHGFEQAEYRGCSPLFSREVNWVFPS
jgi:hypothetical protein